MNSEKTWKQSKQDRIERRDKMVENLRENNDELVRSLRDVLVFSLGGLFFELLWRIRSIRSLLI